MISTRCLGLPREEGLSAFVAELGKLRVWGREPSVKLGKVPADRGAVLAPPLI